MAEPIEKHQTPLTGLDHRAEALALLGNFRPIAGTAEALAAAQVHATLAAAEAQAEVARRLAGIDTELNIANMSSLTQTLPADHPLRGILSNVLLQHLHNNTGAIRTDVMLAVRIRDLGLEIKAGDDIVVGNADGSKSLNLLVVDPDNDEWLQLVEDEKIMNKTVDSMKIHEFFGSDIRSLTVTLKDSPTI